MNPEIKDRFTGKVIVEAGKYKNAREAVERHEANLCSADLCSADLSYAEGIIPVKTTPLLFLFDQPGKIYAYKMVNSEGYGYAYPTIKYEIGQSYEVLTANTDVNVQCGEGINVATLDWCLREYIDGYRILIVEFEAKDIAAIPTCTDGKFRLFRCTVVGEKDITGLI